MRTLLIPLAALCLTGCVDDAASYSDADHSLVVHAEQPHFWDRALNLQLVASNLPGCQRRYSLGTMPAERVDVALYANGNGVYTLQAGSKLWQVETNTCTELAPPAAASGQALGAFRMIGNKMVFVQAGSTTLALR
ncbi:hypothetical protein GCM10027321_15990 [Massilia terrae]|uniref:Lipoprotein n=1 Tax=Massilia terrae TaxID=1811224 RepID=A0ABT2D168_9BURK|nr:hypothetical protein [Massilia terrae]MCS0659979.1 hypothetical protein [Massilia terrae]